MTSLLFISPSVVLFTMIFIASVKPGLRPWSVKGLEHMGLDYDLYVYKCQSFNFMFTCLEPLCSSPKQTIT